VETGIGSTFSTSVEQGTYRLHRSWTSLLATGFVGGLDVSVGVFLSLLLLARTDNPVLAAFGFSFGFIALTLASSELFTENFLVPIAAVVARKANVRDLWRLWAGTAAMNLVGGIVFVTIVMATFPELTDAALDKGDHYAGPGISWHSFGSAVLAGVTITLMTWMQLGAESTAGRLVAAVGAAFLLSYASLGHVIVASLDVYAGILAGAEEYGIRDWFGLFWLWAFGNAVGGIGLVTLLRILQVGPRRIRAERNRSIAETEEAMADLSKEEIAEAEEKDPATSPDEGIRGSDAEHPEEVVD
jgi:formate-nitrite transporter family protein